MSRTRKLTLSAMIAALCVAFLALSALLPQITLSLCAIAGLFPAAVVIACGYGWAFGSAVTAALLALLLLPDKTAGIWFACFFGHYPIWKAWAEQLQTRLERPVIGWGIKCFGLLLSTTVLFQFFRAAFLAPLGFLQKTSFGPYVLAVLLVAAFVLYDLAFSTMIGYFRVKILPRLRK